MNLSIFQELLTPFLTVSLISTKINLFVHWYFQRQFGYCWRQSQKKSIFPRRNHYFGVFHIHYHPMHYNITKKHTLSLHVKNIDIKNYAINSATAVVFTRKDRFRYSRERALQNLATFGNICQISLPTIWQNFGDPCGAPLTGTGRSERGALRPALPAPWCLAGQRSQGSPGWMGSNRSVRC